MISTSILISVQVGSIALTVYHQTLFIMSSQRSEDAHEELLQERLRILLDRLQWSYVTLWTLNPRTRVLEWKRGYFQTVANVKAGVRDYAQLFYTNYKSCCFTPGVGAVGRTNLEGKHIWLTGDAVCRQAGSVEQLQFLRYAEIKTMMCIPWLDSVLEIGTTIVVPENVVLTDRIQQVLANDLVSVVPEPAAGFEHASHPGPATMFPGFHQNEQEWRSANNLSLSLSSDIFTQEPEIMRQNSDTTMAKETLAFGQEAGASSSSSSLHMQAQAGNSSAAGRSEMNQAVNQSRGLMTTQADQYSRSIWSGAVASSTTVSSQEDSSARTSVSPELQHQILANSSANPRFSAHDRTSGTLHSQLPGPQNLNQIRRTNSCGDQYELQKYRTLFESELAANTDATTVPAGQSLPSQGWQPAATTVQNLNTNGGPSKRQGTAKRSNVELMNQVSKIAGPLLRRQSLSALELLKDVDKHQKEAAAETVPSNVPHDVKTVHVLQEPQPAVVQINRPNRRSFGEEQAGNTGPVHAGHDEAAVSHMLAERRRRTKQNENFNALRRVVPIISKPDKASTLIDTITYLKFLENKIQDMKASKEDMDQRCVILENKCKGLRERNQELVEMISKNQPSSALHLNLGKKGNKMTPSRKSTRARTRRRTRLDKDSRDSDLAISEDPKQRTVSVKRPCECPFDLVLKGKVNS